MLLIKRYANRKMYNTAAKGYITLEEVEQLVQHGENVQIIDNESQEDITAATLSLIIAERAKKQKSYSPSLFVQMIRNRKNSMYEYFRKVIQTIGGAAFFVEEELEQRIKALISAGEITEEEGQALKQDIQKSHLEDEKKGKKLEKMLSGVLQKLNLPAQEDIKKLQNSLQNLETKIKQLENQEPRQ